MNLTAKMWNSMYPVGTLVRYWGYRLEHSREPDEYLDTVTRSAAWDTPSGSTIVKCNGIAGGLSTQHLMPLLLEPVPWEGDDCPCCGAKGVMRDDRT